MVVLIRLRRTLRLSQFLVELSCVLIAIVKVNVSTINSDRFSESEIIGSEEFSILSETFLSSEEIFSNWKTVVLLFFFVHLYRVIFEVEKHFHLAISFVFKVAFNYRFLKISVKPEDMSVQMYPIWLVELGGVSVGIFGVEMFMGGGKVWLVDVSGLNIFRLTRQWVSGGFDVVNVPIGLLFLS